MLVASNIHNIVTSYSHRTQLHTILFSEITTTTNTLSFKNVKYCIDFYILKTLLTLLFHTCEVIDSNLSLETGYPD